MIKCHFVDISKTFNPEEIKKFREYLDSPYFNKRKKLLKLFDVITNYYPFFTDEHFTRENIFQKVYSGENYSYGKINEGLSALYKLSLNYLRQVSFENNDIYSDVTFLEGIRKKSLKNIFKLQSRQIDSKLNKFTDIDSNLFLKQYLVQIEKINFTSIVGKNTKAEKIDSFILSIRNMLVSLCNFYISEVISICVNKFNYSRAYINNPEDVFEKIYHSGIFSKLFEVIKPFNKYDSYLDLLNCFFEAIHDLGNKERYYHYKQKVFSNIPRMSIDDIGYHMNCLKSYCVLKRKHTVDGEEFSREYLSLQETILEKKLFINSKSEFFLKEQFLNLIATYDALKNKSKIKNLSTFVKHLHPDFRDDMKYLAEAHFQFHNYSYENSLKYLRKITNVDKAFEEKINNLELRSLFELGKIFECVDKINLYKKNYRANTFLSKKRIASQLCFLNTLEKLIKIKEKDVKFDASYLKNQLDKTESIPSKEWLIEKCYELYEKPKQVYQY